MALVPKTDAMPVWYAWTQQLGGAVCEPEDIINSIEVVSSVWIFTLEEWELSSSLIISKLVRLFCSI